MLGYIGLPSSYFEGMPLASRVAQTLGEKGAVGSVGELAKWGVGKVAEHSTLVADASEYVANAYKAVSEAIAAKSDPAR